MRVHKLFVTVITDRGALACFLFFTRLVLFQVGRMYHSCHSEKKNSETDSESHPLLHKPRKFKVSFNRFSVCICILLTHLYFVLEFMRFLLFLTLSHDKTVF